MRGNTNQFKELKRRIDYLKKHSKDDGVSEDEIKDLEDKCQKMTDKFIAEVDKAVEAKTKEIMTV